MRTIIILFCLLLHVGLIGQNRQPVQTLSDGQLNNIGWVLSPSLGISTMDGSTAALFNLRAGATFGDRFSLGVYYADALNDIRNQSETLPGLYLDYYSFGGFMEYTLMPSKLLHLSFPLYFGYGEVEMDTDFGSAGLGEANFFQLEPAAMLELNLHRLVRLQMGAGYRLISEMNYRNMSSSDLSGLTAYVGLRLGLFR
jgi:hypothetical protein